MTAHSQARDCALTGPRLRTHKAETAHSQGRDRALANQWVRGRVFFDVAAIVS